MQRFKNKTVLITGGSGGIGREIVSRFYREGASVVVFDKKPVSLKALEKDLKVNGENRFLFLEVDIAQKDQVEDGVVEAQKLYGSIDVLVNNAGWDVFKPFLKTEPQEWQNLIDINLLGVFNLHYCVLPFMVQQGSGRVVNIASDAARVGSSGEAVYAACKAGVVGFSKTIAREHARDGITVNVVCPGPTNTPLFELFKEGARDPEKLEAAFSKAIPMGRIGKPEDVPGAVLFFASEDAKYITGQVLSVSGGLTMCG